MTDNKSKTPEVGDVWELGGIRDYILNADACTVRICYYNQNQKRFVIINYLTKEYVKRAKHLGKAVGSIDDLFKVKSFDEEKYYKDMFGESNERFYNIWNVSVSVFCIYLCVLAIR